MREYRFTVPYPPTVNHMYGRSKFGGEFIKKEGKLFIAAVETVLNGVMAAEPGFIPLTGQIQYEVEVWHPSEKMLARDISNLSKILDDAISKAGFWEDDEYIDLHQFRRAGWVPGGKCDIVVRQVDNTGMRKKAMEVRDGLKRKAPAQRKAKGGDGSRPAAPRSNSARSAAKPIPRAQRGESSRSAYQ